MLSVERSLTSATFFAFIVQSCVRVISQNMLTAAASAHNLSSDSLLPSATSRAHHTLEAPNTAGIVFLLVFFFTVNEVRSWCREIGTMSLSFLERRKEGSMEDRVDTPGGRKLQTVSNRAQDSSNWEGSQTFGR